MTSALMLLTLGWLLLTPTPTQAQTVHISEFLADNQTGIRDAEGDRSDWIEIENPSSSEIDLTGWSLTDDSTRLQLWVFPQTQIPAGGRLLVFASGKDRRRPGSELHTNFQLSSQGEYLALVKPDGRTVEHAFSPAYPPQRPDVAYGLGSAAESLTTVGIQAAVRYKIPSTAEDAPNTWTSTAFNDSSWTLGQWPLGFDATALTNSVVTNMARGRTATQNTTFSGLGAGLALDGDPNTYSHTLPGQGQPARWEVNLTTTRLIRRIVLHNRPDCCRDRLRDIVIQILGANSSVTNYQSARLNPENVLSSPEQLVLDLESVVGGPILGSRVRIYRLPDFDLSGGGTTGDDAEVLSLAEVEVQAQSHPNSLDALVQTDVQSVTQGINSSLLARQTFDDPLAGVAPWKSARLRIRYEDGFIAYFNGQEIARRNAPATPAWNSASITNRPIGAAILYEVIPLPTVPALAQPTGNVLAIQVLNSSLSEGDLLIQPSLEIASSLTVSNQYLIPPTPSLLNEQGYEGVLPEVEFSHSRGFYTDPFEATLSLPGYDAQIYYTTNGSEPTPSTGLPYTSPIPITRTTALRAAAFRPGLHPSTSLSHTYLFLEDVIRQTRQTTATYGFPNTWGPRTSDYGMDPRVIGQNGTDNFGGKYAQSIRDDLKSIPTLAISIGVQDMFGSTGIYSQSEQHGDEYERGVSAEYIRPDGQQGFQINAGLRIQGGAFRSDGLTKKQSLRLIFSADHGPTKLRYPLFGPDASDSFDTLTMRANSNDGYSWDSAGPRALYARDTFGRDTMLDMNGVASHHQFVHLYLNGIYWGLYEMVERPDASFSSTYYGGDKTEWDSMNSGVPTQGDSRAWDRMAAIAARGLGNNSNYFLLQGRNPDGTHNPALTNYLDVRNLADYMIVNLYMGNTDWPQKNYWVGRRRVESTGYKFYMWDAEWSMGLQSELTTDRTGITEGVAVPFAACKANAEFRQLFGDRVYKHFFNQGALAVDPQNQAWDPTNPSANRAAERFVRITSEIERAMVAESARWGDMHATTPYTRDESWAVEKSNLLNSYYPFRSEVVVQQFRNARLYPLLDPPTFSQRGGVVQPGNTLHLGAHIGKIYYTTNGSDPRLIGGGISPSAIEYTGPFPLPGRCRLMARTFFTNAWSAVDDVLFHETSPYPLRLTELHWHPQSTSADSPYFSDDNEFVELQNVAPTRLDLSGATFTRGITYTFPASPQSVLEPGQRIVLVRNREAFLSRYGSNTASMVAGQFEGTLQNNGERLTLLSPFSEVVFDFTYDPAWQPMTDGRGYSLVPRDESVQASHLSHPSTWRCSTQPGGSPGAQDPTPSLPAVIISEVLARPSGNKPDQIELSNPTTSPASIGGWYLTDDIQVPQKFRIPPGTVIPAGGFISFTDNAFNPRPRTPQGFGLSAEGETLHLIAADPAGNLLGYSDSFTFAASRVDQSFAKVLSSTRESWAALAAIPTFGSSNALPAQPSVVITEVHTSPLDGRPPFIELQNQSSSTIVLGSASAPAQRWRLRGRSFTHPFSTDITLEPGQVCIVSTVDPTLFQQSYGIPNAGVLLTGSLPATLGALDDDLELQSPDGPSGSYVTLETVPYRSQSPWPLGLQSGASLHRLLDTTRLAELPESWYAATPSPGTVSDPPANPPVLTEDLQDVTAKTGESLILTVRASSASPLAYQWLKNGNPLPSQTNAQLQITSLQLDDAGIYQAILSSSQGLLPSRKATVRILKTPTITKISPDRNAPAGTNLSLAITAQGIGTLQYQWLRNGVSLTGATNSTLTLTNVQPSQSGGYQCVVSDVIGDTLTRAIQLNIGIRPLILDQPQRLMVVQGEVAEFRVMAGGTAPFLHRWRRNGSPLSNQVFWVNSSEGFLRLTNVQPSQAGNYSVNLSNLSGISITSSNAALVVLADFDKDGMADLWEVANGLQTNSAADAALDLDQDGLTNLQEYQVDSNPKVADSAFRIVDIQASNHIALLRFNAASNKTYTIQYRDQWTQGGWNKLTDVHAAPSNRSWTVEDPIQNNNHRAYRLLSPREP